MHKDTKTKDRIISVFINLINEKKSLGNVEVREITSRSGVSLRTFFYYFDNKKALLETSLDIIWGKINEVIENRPPYEKGEYYSKDEIEEQKKHPEKSYIREFFKFSSGWEHFEHFCKIHDIFRAFFGFFINDKKLIQIIFLSETEEVYSTEYNKFIKLIEDLIIEGRKFLPIEPSLCSENYRVVLFRDRMVSTARDILKVLGFLSVSDVDKLVMNYLLSFFACHYRYEIESCIINYRNETNSPFFINSAEYRGKFMKILKYLPPDFSEPNFSNSKLKEYTRGNKQKIFPENKKYSKKVVDRK